MDDRVAVTHAGGAIEDGGRVSTWNAEIADENVRRYRAAIAEFLAVSPEIEPCGNSYNSALPLEFRARSLTTAQSVAAATFVFCRTGELMDSGRPKVIEPQFTVWRGGWFSVQLQRKASFLPRVWECAQHEVREDDEPGRSFPAHAKDDTYPRVLTLDLGSRSWGLKDWRVRATEIESFCDEAPASVRDEYRRQVARASAEVARWEAAIRSVQALTIPAAHPTPPQTEE